MKKINKWLFIILSMCVLSSCTKEVKEVEVNELESEVSETQDNTEIEASHLDEETAEEVDKEEVITEVTDEESTVISNTDLINELFADEWIEEESIYVAKDEAFVVYKRWLDDIGSMAFELYIWEFINEPLLIEEAIGFVQSFELSPNEKQMIIHMGTSPITTGLVYNIDSQSIVTELETVDLAIWTQDSEKIIGRKVTQTIEDSVKGYIESLIYWDNTIKEPIEFMSGKYDIHFEGIEGGESNMKVQVVFPEGEPTDLLISYELLSNNNYPELYSVDPYRYIQAMIAFTDTFVGSSGLMTQEYGIYWDMSKGALMMWTLADGEILLEEDSAAYTDFIVSPNERYIALTLASSSAGELIVVDSETKSIIYRNGPVYDELYWSLDSQYLAFNILNDKIINPNLEIDVSMDVGLLYLEDLIGKRIAIGTEEYYVLVEGFNESGLDVYEADKEFQKTTGYTINNEELIESKNNYEDINVEEEKFELLVIEFENDYATQRVNDGITAVEEFYVRNGYETMVPAGFIPISSTIDRYSIYDGFISLFFTYKYRNEEGAETKLYDSLTYHSKDGVLVDFDLMFKAEEIENVFSQMLKDEVENSDIVLIKEYVGFTNEAKFYFVEEGLIVYYKDGLYTTKGQGPLYVKLLWDDLKGVIETNNLVY